MEEQPKPGFKTSEFWLSFLAQALGLVLASGLLPDSGQLTQILGLAAAALAALGYSASRGYAKGQLSRAVGLASSNPPVTNVTYDQSYKNDANPT